MLSIVEQNHEFFTSADYLSSGLLCKVLFSLVNPLKDCFALYKRLLWSPLKDVYFLSSESVIEVASAPITFPCRLSGEFL